MFGNLAIPNWVHFAPLLWALLGVLGFLGMLALFSPRRFRSLTESSNQWVDTAKLLEFFDHRFEIDGMVLRFTRALGLCVLASVGVFAYLFALHLR